MDVVFWTSNPKFVAPTSNRKFFRFNSYDSRVFGLRCPDASLLAFTMKISLSIACAQFGVVLGPAVSSRLRILRTGKVPEIIRGCYTPTFIPHRIRNSLGHTTAGPSFDEADELDSYRDEQGFCNSLGSHCVGATPQDSKEAQCPTGEDHLKEVTDEHASKALNLHSCVLESSDNEISTVVTVGPTLERADSVVVSRLPTSNDGRLEEPAIAVETLNRSLLSVIEELENLVRQKETLNGSHNSSQVVKGMNQSAMRRAMRRDGLKPVEKIDPSAIGDKEKDRQSSRCRMEMKAKVPKREAQRILTGSSGSKREYGKLNQHRAAIQRIREYDERFMGAALEEARKAAIAGEVPVGAVIVQKGKIVARAYNRVESNGDPTAHAEMLCLRSAARHRGDWRLVDAILYVTLEPCPMCAGAILQSRVKGVVWGSRNTLLGADGSWVSLFPESEDEVYVESAKSEHKACSRPLTHPFNTSIEVRREVLADDCATVMRNFFKARRKENGNFMKTMPWWLPLSAWVLLKRLLHWLTTVSKD